MRIAASLSESGLDYVTTARYNRAEINPEYAARMCTPHFYTTAIRIIQQNKR